MSSSSKRDTDENDSVNEPPSPPPPESTFSESVAPPRTSRKVNESSDNDRSAANDIVMKKRYGRSSERSMTSAARRPGAESVTEVHAGSSGRAGVRAVLDNTESGRASSVSSGLASRKSIPECQPAPPPRSPAVSTSCKSASNVAHISDCGDTSAKTQKQGLVCVEEINGDAISDGSDKDTDSFKDDFKEDSKEEDSLAHVEENRLESSSVEPTRHSDIYVPQTTVSLPMIEVVATPVEDYFEDYVDISGSQRKNPFKDWRVLVLIIVAVGVIVGLSTANVINNKNKNNAVDNGGDKESNNEEDYSPANGPDDGEEPIPDDVRVEIDPFRMEMVSDGNMDSEKLVNLTTSHLSEEMGEAFSEFKNLDLSVQLEEVRRGQWLRRLSKTTKASFQGSMTIEGRLEPPSTHAIRSVRNGAFFGSKLDEWLQSANERLGVTAVAVFDEVGGEVLGAVGLEDGEGTESSDPTSSPLTMTEMPNERPTSSPTPEPATSTPSSPTPEPATPVPTEEGDAGTEPTLPTPAFTDAPTFPPTTTTHTVAPVLDPTTMPSVPAPSLVSSSPSPQVFLSAPLDNIEKIGKPSSTLAPTTAPPTPVPQPVLPPTVSVPVLPQPPEPRVLTTPQRWKFSRSGAMFNVLNIGQSTLNITTLSLHTELVSSDIGVEVWTRTGSYVDHETNQGEWAELNPGTGFVIPRGRGTGQLTQIPQRQFKPIPLAPGTQMALYVTLTRRRGMLVGPSNKGVITVSDDNLLVEAGAALGYRFDNFVSGRFWNGAVHYILPSS